MITKRLLVATCSALALFSFGTAVAADVETSSDWTGPYAGILIGGAKPDFDNHWNPNLNYNNVPTFNAVDSIDQAGALAGVRFGANYETGGIVAGIEADASLAWLQNNTYYIAPYDDEVTNSQRAEFTIDAIATVRGKLGMAFDDFLVYGTGGVGYVAADFAASTSDTNPRSGLQSMNSWHPVVGGGIDWRMTQNVVVGATALYHVVDNDHFVGNLGDGGTTDSRVDFKNMTTIDLSLKYHF